MMSSGPEQHDGWTQGIADSVTDVLVSRERRRQSITPMVAVSLVGHVAVFGVLAILSVSAATPPPTKVFVVSFTGGPGPRTGGANQMGGRAVEEVAPPTPKAVDRPAALKPPKMVIPEPEPKTPPKSTSRAADNTKAAPPTTGAEVTQGSSRMDTGVRGNGFGLSGGGGGASSNVQLDVSDFCCPDYVQQVVDRIKDAWMRDQGRPGETVIRFTIRRDGSVDAVTVERTSGFGPLDFAAQRAVQLTRHGRLPAQFTGESLTIHLTFIYER